MRKVKFVEKADAVVVGGGVIGASVAYRLARQGRKTILVEKGSMASGASGACDKAVFLQSKKPGFHMELAQASMEIYENLETELDVPFEYQQEGGMIVLQDEEHRPMIDRLVKRQQKGGISVELLNGDEARKRQPELASDVTGATWSEKDAEVNPLLLTHAFRQAAVRHGAIIRTNTEVVDILTEQGKVSGVITNKGKIATDVVVNAAGAHAGEIGRMIGIDIPVAPRKGVILVTEKIPRMIRGNVLCTQYIFLKHSKTEGANGKMQIGLSLGQTHSGNLLIGGSREFAGFDRTTNVDVVTGIAAHATRLFPFLKHVSIIRAMVGFRPYTGDGLPIIDEASEAKGFFTVAGHEGDGIALAPVTGRIAVDLIENSGRYLSFANQLGMKRMQTV